MQRLRLTYRRGEPVRFVSHLDMMRLWLRALRRADLPLAYSEGFNPHPRLAFAGPLAVGVTSEAEILDLYLATPLVPAEVLERLRPQLPPGIAVGAAEEVALARPALQALLRSAEYTVVVATRRAAAQVQETIAALLAATSLPRERQREGRTRAYDLRPLIETLCLVECRDGRCSLTMRLRAEGGATGRPEEVAKALGLDDIVSLHRTRLILAEG